MGTFMDGRFELIDFKAIHPLLRGAWLAKYNSSLLSSHSIFSLTDAGDDVTTRDVKASFGLVKVTDTLHSGFWALCANTGTFENVDGESSYEKVSEDCYWSSLRQPQAGLPSFITFVNNSGTLITEGKTVCTSK